MFHLYMYALYGIIGISTLWLTESIAARGKDASRYVELHHSFQQLTAILQGGKTLPTREKLTNLPSEFLTIAEVASRLNISRQTASRRFAGLPGVIDVGNPQTRAGRRYRVLRVPATLVRRFVRERAA